MVTMTDLKKIMAKFQRDYEKSEYYVPGTHFDFVIEFNPEDGGVDKFMTDRADNWYVHDFVDAYYDDHVAYIMLCRYADADEGVE